jgi:hypothetical protein
MIQHDAMTASPSFPAQLAWTPSFFLWGDTHGKEAEKFL